MKDSLKTGAGRRSTIEIDRGRTIDFMGENARVYATPMLIADIETTCRELLLSHADPGEDSVGTHIHIDHTAATLMNMTVNLSVTVTEVNGRAVMFDVSGCDDLEEICRGKHQRIVVDVKKTQGRLAAKAKKAGLS